jgi:hypothetical protein
MKVSVRAVAAVSILALLPSTAAAQNDQGRVTGRVTDGSGGALPGVTVTVAGPGLKAPITVITDDVGQYLTPPLKPDVYVLSFQLSGFETRTSPQVPVRAGEVFMLDRQLDLASLEETVTVVAPVPPPPPKPEPLRLEPVRKPPQPVPVPRETLASVCGPAQPSDALYAMGHIVAHRDDPKRQLYGNGDVLLVDVGSDFGMKVGQNYVVRRRFRIGDKGLPLKQATFGEQTSGLVQIVEAAADTSSAVVVYSCGEFMAGDVIQPFDALPIVSARNSGKPQFDEPAKIIFGDEGASMAAPKRLMVIDRGASQGVQRGQRLTVFRRVLGDHGPVSTIADAIIVAVGTESSTIRIERSSDVVSVGDMVALHR